MFRIQFRSFWKTVTFVLIVLLVLLSSRKRLTPLVSKYQQSRTPVSYSEWGPFHPMRMSGFVNTGLPSNNITCEELRYTSESLVGVQNGISLYDDLTLIADSLAAHPMIHYPEELGETSVSTIEKVEKTWSRMSGSCAWLPEQHLYLCVTRVVFFTNPDRVAIGISFLRGQVYDENWNHLDNHTLNWNDEPFNFPVIFDLPIEYGLGGSSYGMEDPRIILEDAPGAEPVIIFNMISGRSDWSRAMWIFRPFSGFATVLTIQGTGRPGTEKNWSPFFVAPPHSKKHREPSDYMYFVYNFKPLQIVRCELDSGDCEFVFKQQIPTDLVSEHLESYGSLRGGTQFVPVPIPAEFGLRSSIRVHAAFPRTHVDYGCPWGASYKPELAVMINERSHFHMMFSGEPLEFGSAVLNPDAFADTCGHSRILLANSIAQWDTADGRDVMTMTFTVADSTVQVARISGLLSFIQSLPHFNESLRHDVTQGQKHVQLHMRYAAVGEDVVACTVEAATNYTAERLGKKKELWPGLDQSTKEEAKETVHENGDEEVDRFEEYLDEETEEEGETSEHEMGVTGKEYK